jgi:hypothetical protein
VDRVKHIHERWKQGIDLVGRQGVESLTGAFTRDPIRHVSQPTHVHHSRDRDGPRNVPGDIRLFLEIRAHNPGMDAKHVLFPAHSKRQRLSDLPASERLEVRDVLPEMLLQQTNDLLARNGRLN